MAGKSSAARLLQRRAKDSEREGARWFIMHDGPDPNFMPGNGVVSQTGRVGHINGLQYDAHSLHYAVENKHIRLNATWVGWWRKILAKAAEHGKEACLRVDPSNKEATGRVPVMHIITPERHAWLLHCERYVMAHHALYSVTGERTTTE